ncbi:MAG: DUF1214 domain-containing protein, partial [Gemmatimonadota bacterium]|nr:DUF1214 domain-containing protein [Gemmatimonadota bacterium]
LHELLDLMKEVDRDFFCEARGVSSEDDVAEGHLLLTHLIKAGLECYVDNHPEWPHFTKMITPTMKYGGDGPDHHLYFAPLRGDRGYRIRGRMLGEVYLSFTVYGGDEGEATWSSEVLAHANHRQLEMEADGSYEIVLSRERGKGDTNWLQLADDTISVISRHYFENAEPAVADRAVVPHLEIAPLEAVAPPLPLSDARLASKLRDVGRYLRRQTIDSIPSTPESVPRWWSLVPHDLPKPETWNNDTDGGGYGAVDAAYSAAPFALAPDEALVMEGRLPTCAYANVTLWNRYLCTFDYTRARVGLNRANMEVREDGGYRIIVSAQDPGVTNWLDTGGRPAGIIYWRFLLPETEIEKTQCRVVPFNSLAGE